LRPQITAIRAQIDLTVSLISEWAPVLSSSSGNKFFAFDL
jgi:hypothetical protein